MIAADSKARIDFLAQAGEMGERIRAFDWTSTGLGPIEDWPQSLKTSVSLILSSRHPMWIGWGREMTFLYNDAYVRVLGPAKHPSALGRPAAEVWAEIWDVCGPLAEKVFEHGEASFVDDVRLFMNRGDFLEETFYSFSYSPIRDEFGLVCGLFCPSTDVTSKVVNARRLRTLSELAATALKEKTAAAACATAAHILAKNPDDIPFALLYLTDEGGKFASVQQVVGSFEPKLVNASPVTLTDDSANVLWPVAEVFRTGQRRTTPVGHIKELPRGVAGQPVGEAVVLPVTLGGEHKPYGVLVAGVNPCRPLDTDHSTFFELVGGQVATAIQNAQSAEDEKRRADLLAEIDRAKTAFFSNVSHEFRTPLTLTLGPLEDLLQKPENLRAEDREQLIVAHRNSLRLLKLVNSLLDFSRIEAGRMTASYAPTDLTMLTADLASNFRSTMESAGLALIVECGPLPEPVYVDREMWEKILLNLLSNAFKFTFEGSVKVNLEARDGQAVVTVTDTGIGISEEELPRIFQRFHRIENATGRTYEGTGIGLALIQELVKLHGGSISVASRLGEGSTFTVRLPFGTKHLPQEQVRSAAKEPVTATVHRQAFTREAMTWLSRNGHETRPLTGISENPSAGTAETNRRATPKELVDSKAQAIRKARVLVADDNADMREYVTRVLGQEYEVMTANDGRQALEMIRENPPDLVLTDVMMPGLDGFGLSKAVRAEPAMQTVPIIFLSARAGEEMRVEGLQAGAEDYLVKPFTANELRARVGTHVNMAIARRQTINRETELRAVAEGARAEAETLNEISRLLTGERDLDKLVQTATDAGTRLTNAKFGAFFYNVQNESGEAYLLYTLSGASREAFEKFGLPRNTPIFEPTFRGTRIVRSDDILKDPNYGKMAPHYGMPVDHLPVRSYLAVPVIGRSGEVLGGLFFGHPEPGIFTERAERIAVGLARQTAVAIDNARLFAKAEQEINQRKGTEKLLRESEQRFREMIDAIPAAIYTTDAGGRLTHYNPAAVALSGRVPELGTDQWCVTWKLFTADGAPLPHEEYPMALGLRGEQVKPGIEYVAERPDGTRFWFTPFPKALRDENGRIVGGISMLVDITQRRKAEEAALLLAAIVDSSDDAIISKDLTGTITSWNKGAERLFGYTAAETIGKSITILIPPERLAEEPQILSRLQRGERVDHFETIRRRKDGTLLNISLTISPVKDSKGKIIGASKIARDITERKRAEAALHASETRFRQLADSMPQMVWTARPDGYLDYFNERWYEFTGYERDGFGDTSWAPVVHPDDLERCYEGWYASVRSGEPYQMENRFWDRGEKRWRWFMARALPVRDQTHNIVKWFGTWTDIDDQKRVEDELRRANQDLEQFAYSASHDLQEPLRSVKIYSELLTRCYRGKLDGRGLEFCDYLSDGATRMEMLVRDLLAYTQVSKLEVVDENADANKALEEALANLKGTIDQTEARITADPLPSLSVHSTHLKQLFQNLIGNAIKYRSPERSPVIHVSAGRENESWVLSVKDNGIGIDPEYKERIFGLFKRLHSGDQYSGTGIGLAICQRIMERYHGRIWVESTPGEGSTFLFRVPA
jgi:PAS domain S-box-containing protein